MSNLVGHIELDYDEAIKQNPKYKKEVVNRWRKLGLVTGIKPNSITEKRIAESYERMALYLIKNHNDCEPFETVMFPIIRRILTVNPFGFGGHINRVVKPEEIFSTLETCTVENMYDTIKEYMSKSEYETCAKFIFNYLSYKGFSREPIINLFTKMPFIDKRRRESSLNFILFHSNDEDPETKKLFNKIMQETNENELFEAIIGVKNFDGEAEIVRHVSAFLIQKLK